MTKILNMLKPFDKILIIPHNGVWCIMLKYLEKLIVCIMIFMVMFLLTQYLTMNKLNIFLEQQMMFLNNIKIMTKEEINKAIAYLEKLSHYKDENEVLLLVLKKS